MKQIKINFKEYCFKPQWKFIVLTLLLLSLFIHLGFWQLKRGKEKQLLQMSYASHLKSEPLELSQVNSDINNYRYFLIQMKGTYDDRHSFLIDNKFYQHQVGYEVITPFMPQDSNKTVLVNRGWIPSGRERNILPTIPAAKGEQIIQGYVYVPGKTFVLGQSTETLTAWPQRVQAIQLENFSKALQKPVYSFIVLLAEGMPDGFERHWQPTVIPAQKHMAYAVQWFSFAFILIILFIYLNFYKNEQ